MNFFLAIFYSFAVHTQTQRHTNTCGISNIFLISSTIHILIFPLLPFPNIFCIISPFFFSSLSVSNTVKNELSGWAGGSLNNKNKKEKKRRNRNDMYCEEKNVSRRKRRRRKKSTLEIYMSVH